MTKSELIAKLASLNPLLNRNDASASVDTILEAIAGAIVKGNRVEIRGFGSFGLNHRPPRVGRNPKTGERVEVAAKYVPHFKPGKEMRDRIEASAVVDEPVRKIA